MFFEQLCSQKNLLKIFVGQVLNILNSVDKQVEDLIQ